MGLLSRMKAKKDKSSPNDMYLYTEQELDEYESFIQTNYGEYDQVLHEIVSPDIHLDIIMVPPTPEDNYYKLVTMGMGAYAMNVPENLKDQELEHAELVLYLPPDWDLKSNKEKDYWPVRYLKILGRLPLECDTWLGFGHTVHGDEKHEPFAENTKFNTVLLLNACNLLYENMDLRLSTGKKINFYQMFPIYQEELEYKLQHSLHELLDLFDDEDIMPILNIDRKNYGLL